MRIVTVSTDTPAEIRLGRGLHGLKATMLADPTLAVTDRLGLRNRNFNNFKFPNRPGLPVRIIVNRDLVLQPYQPLFFNRGSSR